MATSFTQDVQLANFAALAYKSDGLINGDAPAGWKIIDAKVEGRYLLIHRDIRKIIL